MTKLLLGEEFAELSYLDFILTGGDGGYLGCGSLCVLPGWCPDEWTPPPSDHSLSDMAARGTLVWWVVASVVMVYIPLSQTRDASVLPPAVMNG